MLWNKEEKIFPLYKMNKKLQEYLINQILKSEKKITFIKKTVYKARR